MVKSQSTISKVTHWAKENMHSCLFNVYYLNVAVVVLVVIGW